MIMSISSKEMSDHNWLLMTSIKLKTISASKENNLERKQSRQKVEQTSKKMGVYYGESEWGQ